MDIEKKMKKIQTGKKVLKNYCKKQIEEKKQIVQKVESGKNRHSGEKIDIVERERVEKIIAIVEKKQIFEKIMDSEN